MRALLYISIIFIFAPSCKPQSGNAVQTTTNFDFFPLPLDSTEFYFKTKPNWTDTTKDALDTFVNTWYSKMLFVLGEPILKNYQGEKAIYRFTWLRSFNHPVSVRLEKQGNIVKLFSKVSNGAGGYKPGKIIFDTTLNLTQNHVDTINSKLDVANFSNLQTELLDETAKDGSEWIIEVYRKNKYHVVIRSTPQKGTAFRTIGEYLFSISQVKNEMKGRDQGDY